MRAHATRLSLIIIMHHEFSIPNLLHFLDDYLCVSVGRAVANRQLAILLCTFSYFGVPLAPAKVEGSSSTLKFLGIICIHPASFNWLLCCYFLRLKLHTIGRLFATSISSHCTPSRILLPLKHERLAVCNVDQETLHPVAGPAAAQS